MMEKLAFTREQIKKLSDIVCVKDMRTTPVVMVVEDQGFSSKLLTSIMGSRYSCVVASRGEKALDVFVDNAPDLVFMDIDLPDASGHDLATMFKAAEANVKIVMVTANNYSQDVKRAKENGVDGFIAKPFNKKKIMTCLSQLL